MIIAIDSHCHRKDNLPHENIQEAILPVKLGYSGKKNFRKDPLVKYKIDSSFIIHAHAVGCNRINHFGE